MATPIVMIENSLALIRSLEAGQAVPPETLVLALSALNSMLDTWSASPMRVHQLSEDDITLVAGDYDMTIGPGGDVDTVRPEEIDYESSYIRDAGGMDTPIYKMSEDEYAAIPDKDNGQSTPQYLFYRAEFPLGRLKFWPPPSSGLTLHLASTKPFTAVTDQDIYTDVNLPPGYQETIEYNLALRLAPRMGKAASADVVATAGALMNALLGRNMQKRPSPSGLEGVPIGRIGGSGRNIYTM